MTDVKAEAMEASDGETIKMWTCFVLPKSHGMVGGEEQGEQQQRLAWRLTFGRGVSDECLWLFHSILHLICPKSHKLR